MEIAILFALILLNGIAGEAALATSLAQWVMSLGLNDPYASYAAAGLVVVSITHFSIVLGERVPKRLGRANPEAVAPTNALANS